MGFPNFTLFSQAKGGFYFKKSDASGPYIWDGTDMVLADKEGGESATVTVNNAVTFDTVTFLELQTSATGATYVALGSVACSAVELKNDSGTTLEFRMNGAGTSYKLQDGQAHIFEGITNANQISGRRVDQSNTQVTISGCTFANT